MPTKKSSIPRAKKKPVKKKPTAKKSASKKKLASGIHQGTGKKDSTRKRYQTQAGVPLLGGSVGLSKAIENAMRTGSGGPISGGTDYRPSLAHPESPHSKTGKLRYKRKKKK